MHLVNDSNVDILLIGGPQGSGKSSLATSWFRDRKRINRDEIRRFYLKMTTGKDWEASDWTPTMEPLVTEIEMAVLRKELGDGHRVVIDNTIIREDLRRPYIDLAEELGKTVGCLFLALPLDWCREKNQSRHFAIPDHVLCDYYTSMSLPRATEGFDMVQIFNQAPPLN